VGGAGREGGRGRAATEEKVGSERPVKRRAVAPIEGEHAQAVCACDESRFNARVCRYTERQARTGS